jgi:hypothetical protein
MRSLLFFIYCLFFFSQISLAAENKPLAVGQVVYILGKAQIFNPISTATEDSAIAGQILQRGSEVYIGSKILTESRAQVGIRMIDGATLQIRENSHFIIQQYHYDAQFPEQSEVKFFLKEGEINSKTGTAGKAAKHKYRLNTPIAAIGIRGTEFVVKTDREHTRVDVLSGGVVVSPFTQGCSLTGIGPCRGQNAVELFADHRNASLILQRNAVRPLIIKPVIQKTSQSVAPNTQSSTTSTSTESVVQSTEVAVQPSASTAPPSSNTSTNSSPNTTTTSAPASSSSSTTSSALAKGAAETTSTEPSVKWGRWNPELASNKAADGYELVTRNADYAIIRRADDNFILPNTGKYQFVSTRHEAYVRDVSKDEYTQADIQNARLSIDFVERNFETEFDLVATDLNSHVQATGSLNEAGVFSTTQENTNTYINGAVGGEKAEEASYAFYHQIDATRNAAGAIDWTVSTAP